MHTYLKKTFLLFSILLTTMSIETKADEGMWTLSNLPQAVYEKMVEEGYHLPYNSLYNDKSAISKAVVNFGGYCSGVVVSADGLVFTNHHCGFEAIRSHSTIEHDYMLNGFVSKSYEEELPNENLFVSFMVSQRDYTTEVLKNGIRTLSMEKQSILLDSLENVEQERVMKEDSTLRVELKPYYEGNKYYLTTYRDFRDVRLVFTIPKSMGKFGGETDNWMWPRQTCDFSVFRIYCDPKTGGPADYSKDNVPYHPEVYAKVNLNGYEEGGFAMTMGYPDTTNRYLSSYGIQEMKDCQNAPRHQVRTVLLDVMRKHMRADDGVRIKYDSKFAQSANYWKNARGMNKCIDSIGIIKMKKDYEQLIKAFQDSTGYLKEQLDIEKLEKLYAERSRFVKAATIFSETFIHKNEIVTRALQWANGMTVFGPEKKKKKQYVQFNDNTETWDLATEKEILAALLKNYREQIDNTFLPEFYKTIDGFGGDDRYTKYVDALYASPLMSNEKIFINNKKVGKTIANDLAVQMGQDLLVVHMLIRNSIKDGATEIQEQERMLCDAKLRMEMDMPHYSDANFTLRLSYGQVGGFVLNGKQSEYYTAPKSLYEKMLLGNKETAGKNYNYEYFAEPEMHTLFSASDFGKYTDSKTGTMNLCFLTNNDITGGNSGSPVFDGNNQLIGLAFDGNWDSLSGSIFFDKTLARCICVDIRYILFMMEKWGKANRLIEEIKK